MNNKRYYTAGQSPAPAASNLRFDAAFRGKPRGIKPFVSSLARSCPRLRGRDLAPFVNNQRAFCNEQQLAHTPAHFSCHSNSLLLSLFSLLLAICSFLLFSCQNPIALPANSGSFSLVIADTDTFVSERTILPDAPELSGVAVYTLAFTATSGGANISTDRTNATLANPIVLVAGTYSLTVSAYKDAAKTQLIAQGTTIGIVITTGGNTTDSVTLKPIFDGTGKGTFQWDIAYSGITVNTASMTIKDSASLESDVIIDIKATPAGSHDNLTSGLYTVTIKLEGEDSSGVKKSVVYYELLHIYSALTSRFPSNGTFTFSDSLFYNTHWNFTVDENYSGGGITIQSVEHGSSFTPAEPARSIYTFTGWNTAADGSGTTYLPGDSVTVTADMILYAQWSLITYTVSFNSNGGTTKPAITGVSPGSTITLPTNPTKPGNTFGGWFTDDATFANQFTASTVVTGDITVYAKWTVGITFNVNGGTSVSSITGLLSGTTQTLPSTVPTKNYYTFTEWNTASNGSGTAYNPGDSITVTVNITLYARWEVTNPILISDEAGLRQVGSDLNAPYKLTADITLTSEWTPISGTFAGIFDGDGHTISGMTITAGTGNRAMFLTINSGGVVRNLGLLDVNIESSRDAGAIAGNLYDGLIENCFATGTIRSTTTAESVGGLVGWGGSTAGLVKNSYFIGTVEGGGSGAYVGGIYGFANSGHVENCYAAGVVGPGSSAKTGGIAGDTAGTIKNSVALSDLKLFSGTTAYRISDSGITNCYARDDLTITVGSNAPIVGTAGTSANTANGANVTAAEYNTQTFWETTMGWDFTTIWEMGTVTIPINGTPTSMSLPVLQTPAP